MIALRPIARLAAAGLALTLAASAAGQSVPCGEPYVVRRGDTLQRIAERAYGPEASFRDLMPANRGAFVNGDPSVIEVGQTLTIPCLTRTSEGVTDGVPARQQWPAPGSVPTRPLLLTIARSDGTDAEARIADLAEGAGIASTDTNGTPVDPDMLMSVFAGATQPLIADALPRPDCAGIGLAPATRELCSRLAWSEQVAEYVLSTFTLADAGPLTRDQGLRDQRLCFPLPMPIYLLEGRGLTPPAAEIQQPADVAACFTALRTGTVDAVIAPAVLADRAMAMLGPGAEIAEQFALSQLVTLHSVALAEDIAAVEALDRLEEALRASRRAAAGHLGPLPD